ncbi:MAG TPA: tetratricopeptide repeat protein, partial [Candidatus Eisenbacteria bacterium]
VAPATLNDVNAWNDYKMRSHMLALPEEARLFYRRGLMLHASGAGAEALKLVRGAVRLDPGFLAPRLTLASWLALRDPGDALVQCDGILRLMRESFMFQLVLAANLLYLGLQALFLSILIIAFVVVALHQAHLRHGWSERLASFLMLETAGWWSWVILIAPYLAGLGPALPTLAFLGLLFPTAKLRERVLFVVLAITLAGVPFLTGALDRLSSPLQEDHAPFYGVPGLQSEPFSAVRRADLERRATLHPDSPFLQFAAGWMAQRGGDAVAAERHFRDALAAWPNDDRVLNNLGNALAAQGRADDALTTYRKAIALEPRNAAAHFNASQIYTMRYDFQAANEELARASALDFEMVKACQAERAEAKWARLVDQWIAPRVCWRAMRQATFSTTAAGALPPLWRMRIECSGWTFSMVAFLVAIGSWVLGMFFHKKMPVRRCSNCGQPICRRCVERRRDMALCPRCAVIWSRAESPEFGRLLLFQFRRRLQERRDTVFRVLGVLIPGIGYLPYLKLLRPTLFIGGTVALVCASVGIATPFWYEPRFGVPGHDVPLFVLGVCWTLFYLVTVPIYLSFEHHASQREAKPAPPARRGADARGPDPTTRAAA